MGFVGMTSAVIWAISLTVMGLASGYEPFNPSRPSSPTGNTGARYRYEPPNPTRPNLPTDNTGTRYRIEEPLIPEGSVIPRGRPIRDEQPPESTQPPADPTDSPIPPSDCRDGYQPLTVLAPISHVGQTISTHPTFFWYSPDTAPQLAEFRLYQVSHRDQLHLLKRVPFLSSPGLMSYTLPISEAGLDEGELYLWQVQMPCGPSGSWVATAYVEVVPPVEPEMDSRQLASAGIWYDALAAAIVNPDRADWLDLLASLAQAESSTVETESGETEFGNQRDRLQQVIEQER